MKEKYLDATRALKDTENTLRDFIAQTLERAFGEGWENVCGVTEERISKWHERKQIEAKRQETGTIEERILYYADFYDLKTILRKHWDKHFSEALGDWKTMDVLLSQLENLRDPDAHRRELLPHQHYFALGISGEIRTRISRYRSNQETGESYFPIIESARDSLGNIYIAGQNKHVLTKKNLRPGDSVDFVITASDPLEANLLYHFDFEVVGQWQLINSASVTVEKAQIGLGQFVYLKIKSPREFHAHWGYDDCVIFAYDVLPLVH